MLRGSHFVFPELVCTKVWIIILQWREGSVDHNPPVREERMDHRQPNIRVVEFPSEHLSREALCPISYCGKDCC